MKGKILLLCVTSQSVITFRAKLIKKFQEMDWAVSVIAFDNDYEEEVKDLGVEFFHIQDKNRSLNPFKIFSLTKKYKKLIKQISPNIVFTFMLKPNTFGVLASKSAGVENIYSMVEGAGDVFIRNSFKWKVLRVLVCSLYKLSFRNSKKIFFLNNDDKKEFLQRRLVKERQCEIVR